MLGFGGRSPAKYQVVSLWKLIFADIFDGELQIVVCFVGLHVGLPTLSMMSAITFPTSFVLHGSLLVRHMAIDTHQEVTWITEGTMSAPKYRKSGLSSLSAAMRGSCHTIIPHGASRRELREYMPMTSRMVEATMKAVVCVEPWPDPFPPSPQKPVS